MFNSGGTEDDYGARPLLIAVQNGIAGPCGQVSPSARDMGSHSKRLWPTSTFRNAINEGRF